MRKQFLAPQFRTDDGQVGVFLPPDSLPAETERRLRRPQFPNPSPFEQIPRNEGPEPSSSLTHSHFCCDYI